MLSGNGGQWTQSLYSFSAMLQFISIFQKEFIPFSGALIFDAAVRRYLYIAWGWEARGAYAHRSHRTVTNRHRILKQPAPTGHSKRQQNQELDFLSKRYISLSS